ncbi:MAG: Ig-like domain repeat protein, partial [Elusimicrobiota bacterium]
MKSGETYSIRVRITDKAGNPRVMPADRNFIFDTDEPTLLIQTPATDYVSTLGMISGTVNDNSGTAAIQTVELAISTGSAPNFNSYYWTGSGWQSQEYRFTASKISGGVWANGWKKDTGFPTWSTLDDKTARVRVWAKDNADNETTSVYKTTFTVDTTIAASTTSFPGSGRVFSTLSFSSGTATDAPGSQANPSGIANVEIAIERYSDQMYWKPSIDDFSAQANVPVWSTATYHAVGSSWTYTQINMARFTSDGYYLIKERVTDRVNNQQTVTDGDIDNYGARILIDKDSPVSVSTRPALAGGATAYMNYQLNTLWGTATDAPSGQSNPSGLRQVALRISRINSSQTREWYDWNGNWAVGNSQSFAQTAVAPLSAWSKAITAGHLLNGYKYEAQAQAGDFATDTVGEWTNFETTPTTATFIIDLSTPSFEMAVLSTTALNYINNLALSSGTHSDPTPGGGVNSGVNQIFVELQDRSDTVDKAIPGNASYWDVTTSTWVASAPNPSYQASVGVIVSSWSFSNLPNTATLWNRGDPSPDGRRYRLKARVNDKAGNSTLFADKYSDLVYDVTPPTSSITAPAVGSPPDQGQLESLSSIAGTAEDLSTSTVKQVYISLRNIQLDGTNNNQGICDSATIPTKIGRWWNGSAWNSSVETWLPVSAYDSGTEIWTYNMPGGNWDNDCYYLAKASATDQAGNFQTALIRRGFKITAPLAVTTIDVPKAGAPDSYYKNLGFISGTNNYPDSIEVRLQLQRTSNSDYWNDNGSSPGSWQAGAVSNTVNGSGSSANWDYTPSGNDRDLPVFLDGSS